jgi:hypothetical protein
MMKIEADALRIEIEYLLAQYPDLKDDDDLRADMLEGETDITRVLTALNRYREDTKALADGSQARLDELAARKKRLAVRVEFITSLMQSILFTAQIRKIELPEVTLSIRNNPQQLVGDPDVDIKTLPDDCIRTKQDVDRKAVREAIVAGRNVPGFVLVDAPPSLMVRIK